MDPLAGNAPSLEALRELPAKSTPFKLADHIRISLRRTFPAHIPLYVTSFSFVAASYLLLRWYGLPMPLSSGIFILNTVLGLLFIWLMTMAAYDTFQLWRSGAPTGLLRRLLARMGARLQKEDRPGNSLHALTALMPMLISFSAIKDSISTIHPFSWDKAFEQWDRVFGILPWQMLQAVFNVPAATIALNFAYHLWFFVMFGILVWQIFAPRNSALRLQFLLAFSFVWFFGGSVLAIIFSSAGPCFYDQLALGPSPYAAQAAYLHAIGPQWIWSLAVQDGLWQSYLRGSGTISGISAMPSMHVTIAVLNALLCWRVNHKLGIALWAFAATIFIGSIMLLWHYAVDGIAALAIAYACWALAGSIARHRLSA